MIFRAKGGEEIEIGDPEQKGEVGTVSFPNYQRIRTIFVYGDNIKVTGLAFHLIR